MQGPEEFLDLRPPDDPFCRVPLGLHLDGLAVLAHITAAWQEGGLGVVRRSTEKYALSMTHSSGRPTDISVRQFVADSGAVTRGLRQGRAYTLTLNGEPLARMIPIRQRRAVPKEEVLAIFATAPVVDGDELRADLDEAVSQDLRDPYEGTGL